jgi:hypothetical protein
MEKRNEMRRRMQLIKHSAQTNESVLKLESWISIEGNIARDNYEHKTFIIRMPTVFCLSGF